MNSDSWFWWLLIIGGALRAVFVDAPKRFFVWLASGIRRIFGKE